MKNLVLWTQYHMTDWIWRPFPCLPAFFHPIPCLSFFSGYVGVQDCNVSSCFSCPSLLFPKPGVLVSKFEDETWWGEGCQGVLGHKKCPILKVHVDPSLGAQFRSARMTPNTLCPLRVSKQQRAARLLSVPKQVSAHFVSLGMSLF